CGESSTAGMPLISDLSITQNPNNALSLVVSASVREADSVRVTYWPVNGGASAATPFYAASTAVAGVTVLGLRPATAYALALEAKSVTARVADTTRAVSPSLPSALEGV